MSRKTIYDIIETEEFNAADEYARLCYRFRFDKLSHDGFDDPSISERLKKDFEDLLPLHLRSTSIGFEDLLGRLGIVLTGKTDGNIDDISALVELAMCAQDHDYMYHDGYDSFFDISKIILEKAGMQVVNGKRGRIVIPADSKVSNAAEIVAESGEERLAIELLDYRHRTNNGKLLEKANILRALGNYIEPIIKNNKQSPYCDAGFLLNVFVRHNNNDGGVAKERYKFVSKMNDADKEAWYDKLYDTIIAVIVDNNQKKIKSDIEQLKKSNGLGKYGRSK